MIFFLILFIIFITYVFHTTRNQVISLLEQGKHQEALHMLNLTRPDLDDGVEMTDMKKKE